MEDFGTRIARRALFIGLLCGVLWLCISNLVFAKDIATLQDIEIHPLPQNKAQLEFMTTGTIEKPKIFAVTEPKSIIVDFPHTGSQLSKDFPKKSFDVGIVKSVKVMKTPQKTRAIIQLSENASYDVRNMDNKMVLTLGEERPVLVAEKNIAKAAPCYIEPPCSPPSLPSTLPFHEGHAPCPPGVAAVGPAAVGPGPVAMGPVPGHGPVVAMGPGPGHGPCAEPCAPGAIMPPCPPSGPSCPPCAEGPCPCPPELGPPFVSVREPKPFGILSFDFQRGAKNEARLVFQLSCPAIKVDFRQNQDKIIAQFIGAGAPDRLIRRYDVKDFCTPLRTFAITRQDGGIRVEMDAEGEYEKMAYQMDNQFIIEIRGLSMEEKIAQRDNLGHFVGEKLSFNFQDIEIRAALQILADFAGFNLITSDSVSGNITLRLQNVPWDQALDIILRSKGLDKRQLGNVMLIGPTEEIAAREKMELESLQQVSNLEPLRSELVQINYAKAEDMQTILKEKGNSIMSMRGNVTVDKRTNMLLVQDTASKLVEIKALIRKLDIAVRQVEIATQIVTADNTLEEILGMRFGGAILERLGSRRLGVGATIERARAIGDFPADRVPPSNAVIPQGFITNNILTGPTVRTTEGLFSDLPATLTSAAISPGKLGLALARLPTGTLIDLELQALEFESRVKTISRPKIMTTDKTKAYVEQGFEIPYLEASSSGATSQSFKKAVLRLEVTPQITPDDKLILDLLITNDTPVNVTNLVNGQSGVNGSAIGLKTSRLSTQVLVDNGETIVLGGVLVLSDTKTRAKVPFFGDLPFVGVMFRNKDILETRREVLIFITPRIAHQGECLPCN